MVNTTILLQTPSCSKKGLRLTFCCQYNDAEANLQELSILCISLSEIAFVLLLYTNGYLMIFYSLVHLCCCIFVDFGVS